MISMLILVTAIVASTKWTMNGTISAPAMYPCDKCASLYVDINDSIYCSMSKLHQIVMKSFNTSSNVLKTIAGSDIPGLATNLLNLPRGIFVNINLDLYVADCGNDRIQFFQSGQVNGTTSAGNGASSTITRSCPTGVILDASNYLYVADSYDHRSVASGLHGFRCLFEYSSSN